ncbi:MAG: glycosyltransferase family 2 protein [bacterium]
MKATFPVISAIVPSYNEGTRIVAVVTALKAASHVSEVIVVDDGGNENSRAVLAKLPVKLITHERNKGKAQAVLTGLIAATSDVVLLIDGDLVGITPKIIDDMVEKYWQSGCDLLLGDRQREFAPLRLLGVSIATTGDRMCNRKLLLDNPHLFATSGYLPGYLLEPAMNKIFFHKYRVEKYVMVGVDQTNKIWKGGLSALVSDIKMHVLYCKYLGLSEYGWQCAFARNLK